MVLQNKVRATYLALNCFFGESTNMYFAPGMTSTCSRKTCRGNYEEYLLPPVSDKRTCDQCGISLDLSNRKAVPLESNVPVLADLSLLIYKTFYQDPATDVGGSAKHLFADVRGRRQV